MDIDSELDQFRQLLAQLTPDERVRLLRADFNPQQEFYKKEDYRKIIAQLSPAEKLKLLSELRARSELQRGTRRTHSIRPEKLSFGGGRATASGVTYEVHIASFIAVKMLSGSKTSIWKGISGGDVSAITMQAAEPVDDIVVNLRDDPEANLYISAKERSGTISLTPSNSAFVDTIDSFVRQFLKLSVAARLKSRLIWAIPESVGRAITHDLSKVLHAHRMGAPGTRFVDFFENRTSGEKKALQSLASQVESAWLKIIEKKPSDDELEQFFRQVYVEVLDFGPSQRLQREIEGEIRQFIIEDEKQAQRAWEKIENFFLQADYQGLLINRVWLRKELDAEGIVLKSPPDYHKDIAVLNELTARNLARLRENTVLRFGQNSADEVHIPRTEELSALVAAAKSSHHLITGEPGCGKSGLIFSLVGKLQSEGLPVVLLLAEDNLPRLKSPLNEVLANWPNGLHGFLITDALDAVRDVEQQKVLRFFLRDVSEGKSGWTVIASVREFDLKHSRDLRELFPGCGVAGYTSAAFAGVAHFNLTRLSEAQLDELAAKRPEIVHFIASARKNPKAEEFHRSPFHLHLVSELLRTGVSPLQLADWDSPGLLLRKFWEARVKNEPGAAERESLLKIICDQMVKSRRMVASYKQLPINASQRDAVNQLRSRGILVSPELRQSMEVGGDAIRFTHHLLHDYAIAGSLIPEEPVLFCDFVVSDPWFPIFYRQSFLFAFDELWNKSDNRKEFWEVALKLEALVQLKGVTRILAPILAARRVESLVDVSLLLKELSSTNDVNSAPFKALQHLASGVQDVGDVVIRAGADGWCAFIEQLGQLILRNSSLEVPTVQILARLNSISNIAEKSENRLALNSTGRVLLDLHVSKEISQYRRYFARVAIETLCRTYSAAPAQTEKSLLLLLSPERLLHFPHDDLFELANNIRHLGTSGDSLVIKLFGAAFMTPGPAPGQYEDNGSAIMSLRFQTSDQWHLVRYALAEYYIARSGENAGFMTAAACIARNASEQLSKERILATIKFRNVDCNLVEDFSHISGRGYEREENRILSHFEILLNQWAETPDTLKVDEALDAFAICNRTSLMWTVFFDAGAKHPLSLGVLMESVLVETVFFTHPDYSYGGTALLGALHKLGDESRREWLEKLILDLPKNFLLREGEKRDPIPERIKYAQNRLLNVLEEQNIALPSVRELKSQRKIESELPTNRRPQGPQVFSRSISDEDTVKNLGVDLKKPENEEMYQLRGLLKPFQEIRNKNTVAVDEFERLWPVIEQSEQALKQYESKEPVMAKELWGYLVGACETIVTRDSTWPKTDERWNTIRRILLKASTDPQPEGDGFYERKDEGWPSWGWPAPRIDAARGLPFLALRLDHADQDVTEALRRLCRDNSLPLRFNLADRIAVVEKPAPRLAWELFDTFTTNEEFFSVLDALTLSLDRLWQKAPQEVKPRIKKIADRVLQNAPEKNHIHETIAHSYLFQFLRTGDRECWAYIADRIEECERERANNALARLMGACRGGGWLTAGDGVNPDVYADEARSRTWQFFSILLSTSQAKLKLNREEWAKRSGNSESEKNEQKLIEGKIHRALVLVNEVATELFFASGAFEERRNQNKVELTPIQLSRFWRESSVLFKALVSEPHPQTVHQMVQTLYHLLPCAPDEIFLLATQAIQNSAKAARFQYESLAVGDVVKLIQRALADHRDIFRRNAGAESDCLKALLEVLDLFVEAGWPEARQLTHRLEEIYR